jgi:cytochrome c5
MSSPSIRIAFLVSSLLLSGCYYDKEEVLYPGSTQCTVPETPMFSSDVAPLLNSKCNSCHSGSSPSAGIILSSYAEVIKYVNNGSLMGSIKHASGYSAMPKNSTKMSTCEIQKIQNWIDNGALNN